MTSDDDPKKRFREFFSKKQYDVEHALNMFARSYVTMPAFGIYEDDLINPNIEIIRKCHIYLIGAIPNIEIIDISQRDNRLIFIFESLGKQDEVDVEIPPGWNVAGNNDTGVYLIDPAGEKYSPDEERINAKIRKKIGEYNFQVLYIGQAFGEDGSRSALDRLKKHETLQKIAVKGIQPGYVLTLLMLEITPASRMITMFNPWAKDTESGEQRISTGLDKLFDTNEAERTTLYEASLIRYFQPQYNKEFKNSFPSTNMKILADCYGKDINSIIAEICIDELPFKLFTETIEPKTNHIAHHDLHTDESRKVFFKPDMI